MKRNNAVVAIFILIALNAIFKPINASAIEINFQETIKLQNEEPSPVLAVRVKREHVGKAQSFIDLILKIMNSLQFSKPNSMARGSHSEFIV